MRLRLERTWWTWLPYLYIVSYPTGWCFRFLWASWQLRVWAR